MIPSQFRQIVDNLLSKALKYGASGQQIEVSLVKSEQLITLQVKDYGESVAEEHLESIFERFYRVDNARTHHQGNSGIGLALGAAIVRANGGAIKVESVLGEGSCFTETFDCGLLDGYDQDKLWPKFLSSGNLAERFVVLLLRGT